MPKRRSYAIEVKENGFDSSNEALRMQNLYFTKVNRVNGYDRKEKG